MARAIEACLAHGDTGGLIRDVESTLSELAGGARVHLVERDRRVDAGPHAAWVELPGHSLFPAVLVDPGSERERLGAAVEAIEQTLPLVRPALHAMELQRELQLLREGFHACPLPALVLDAQWSIEQVNPALRSWWGVERDAHLGQPATDVFGVADDAWRALASALQRDGHWTGELDLRHPVRGPVPVLAAIGRAGPADGPTRRHWVHLQDIGEQRAARRALERMAYTDPLTGLPNRALLADRLGMAMLEARAGRSVGALLLLDLHAFRTINNLHGHRHGDLLLQAAAAGLSALLDGRGALFRTAADEFAVLVERGGARHAEVRQEAERLADALMAGQRRGLAVRGHVHHMQACVGIALFPRGLQSPADVLREAATALAHAESLGRDRFAVFDAAMDRGARERYELLSALRAVIANGGLELHLQPQVDPGGRMRGAEALLRWTDPRRGAIAPDVFIPLAEQNGLILDIDRFVLSEACALIARTEREGRPLPIAVNISPLHFTAGDLHGAVRDALERSGASARYLTLELTENVLLDAAGAAAATVERLAAGGVQFAVDDFGTGYSNLRYLQRLNIAEVKIDRSFVQDICSDATAAGLVQGILTLARHLGKHTIAEGVETADQATLLLEQGCGRLQGYYFGAPMPAADCIRRWRDSGQDMD